MGDGGFWHNGLLSGVASNLLNKGDGVLVIMKNGYASATGTQELLSSPPEDARMIAVGESAAGADRTIENTLTRPGREVAAHGEQLRRRRDGEDLPRGDDHARRRA